MNMFKVGRLANAIVGAWLFLSAVLISRTPHGAMNAAIVGAFALVVALVSLYRLPILRFVEIPLAVWLFFSAWYSRESALSMTNDLLAATLLFGFGAVPPDLDPDELRGYVVQS